MTTWVGKSRGTVLGYRIFIFFIGFLGIGFAYFVLRFVALYFFIFSFKSRGYINNFYKKVLDHSVLDRQKMVLSNFYIFGQILIDKFALRMGKLKQMRFSFDGENHLKKLAIDGQGAFLISAHLGNWEIAGNLLHRRVSTKTNVLMLDQDYEKIKNYLQESVGGPSFEVIPIKNDFSHVLKVKSAINNGELVCLHADRYIKGARLIRHKFLNHEAFFPEGPFLLATKIKAPVSFVFCVKQGRGYHLSATKPKIYETIEEASSLFIIHLEKQFTLYPEQWFNYYDFFNTPHHE